MAKAAVISAPLSLEIGLEHEHIFSETIKSALIGCPGVPSTLLSKCSILLCLSQDLGADSQSWGTWVYLSLSETHTYPHTQGHKHTHTLRLGDMGSVQQIPLVFMATHPNSPLDTLGSIQGDIW